MKNKQTMASFIIIMLSILLCFILKKNGLIVSMFSFVYIIGIYIKNSNNTQKFLYYTCVFFAIITLGHKTIYFLAFIMYAALYLYKNFSVIKNSIIQENQRKKITKNLNKYQIFLIVFSLYSLISVIWSINKPDAISYLLRYFIGITLLIIVVIENKSKAELKCTFKLLLYILIGILCIGTLEICGVDFGLPNHYEERYYEDYQLISKEVLRVPVTFFNNPNDNAYFLVIGVALVFYAVFSAKSKKYIMFNYIILGFISINLVFSRSRSGLYSSFLYLALMLALGIINIKKNSKFSKKTIIHSISFIFIIMGMLYCCDKIPAMDFYTEKFIKIGSSTVSSTIDKISYADTNKQVVISEKLDNIGNKIDSKGIHTILLNSPQNENSNKKIIGESGSNNVRITLIYDVVVKGLIEQKNFFGVGVGNSPNFIKKIGNTNITYNVHCMWFEVLCDFGLGIFLYLIYIYISLIYDILRKKDKNGFYVFALGMCSVNIILVFGPSSVIHFAPFWILMGITYAITVHGQNEKKKIE